MVTSSGEHAASSVQSGVMKSERISPMQGIQVSLNVLNIAIRQTSKEEADHQKIDLNVIPRLPMVAVT
eukprot:4917383-Pleurochrysis_carterae.AAC.1